MLWTFVYLVLWVLMAVALSAIMALYLLLEWGCVMFPDDPDSAMTRCFTYSLDSGESSVCTIADPAQSCLGDAAPFEFTRNLFYSPNFQ